MIYQAKINVQNMIFHLDGSSFYNATTKEELKPYKREDGMEVVDVGDIQLPVKGLIETAKKEMEK